MSCSFTAIGDGHFGLAGELCIFHAAELKPHLLEALEAGAECDIDLAQVTEVDTAGLQLLLGAKREAERRGCRLGFVNHSEPVLEALDLVNLARDFGDPLLIPASRTEADHESR